MCLGQKRGCDTHNDSCAAGQTDILTFGIGKPCLKGGIRCAQNGGVWCSTGGEPRGVTVAGTPKREALASPKGLSWKVKLREVWKSPQSSAGGVAPGSKRKAATRSPRKWPRQSKVRWCVKEARIEHDLDGGYVGWGPTDEMLTEDANHEMRRICCNGGMCDTWWKALTHMWQKTPGKRLWKEGRDLWAMWCYLKIRLWGGFQYRPV